MRILITYQYFLPAYKAGGPIQSVNNIATFLSAVNGTELYILCSDRDLDNSVLDVVTNKWVDFRKGVKVYYNSLSTKRADVLNIISGIKPDVIFINGLYSLPYTIYPLLYKKNCRKILSTRGMLHPGALSQKSTKKKLFLTAFKMLGLHRQCECHATTDDEVTYIKQIFGADKKVWMVSNLPNVLDYQEPCTKAIGSVKLVSVSLISPMKNILLVLQALKNVKANIVYHIYGPVKDQQYWDECLKYMQQLPANITVEYKGEVLPHLVEGVLKDYHYFILPSKSENFGHAIYEALSAGKPVITSHNTPWNGLNIANAGYNVDPEHTAEFTSVLEEVASVGDADYKNATFAAKEYITQQYNLDSIKSLYKKMFSSKGDA